MNCSAFTIASESVASSSLQFGASGIGETASPFKTCFLEISMIFGSLSLTWEPNPNKEGQVENLEEIIIIPDEDEHEDGNDGNEDEDEDDNDGNEDNDDIRELVTEEEMLQHNLVQCFNANMIKV